jgi:hypothetical protein
MSDESPGFETGEQGAAPQGRSERGLVVELFHIYKDSGDHYRWRLRSSTR